MFTGLIQATGTIVSQNVKEGCKRILLSAPGIALSPGDSIAVNGVCLTAVDIDPQQQIFHADLSEETLRRTSLARLVPGSVVNLELPTPSGAPLGGHVVQGHVDGVGKLLSLQPTNASSGSASTDWWLSVEVPPQLSRYMIEKGSIAINGISLTIARWKPEESTTVGISIIPHTYAHTNLRTLQPGELVNIEADILLKFHEQRHSGSSLKLTAEYLVANGY